MRGPAILSVMTVVSIPSRHSSHAVNRAPWRNGRVSSANTPNALPVGDRRAYDTQRRAIATRRQSASIAMGEHVPPVRDHLGTVAPECAATLDVLALHLPGLGQHESLELLRSGSGARRLGEDTLHPVNRPEQIHRGRSGLGQEVAHLVELGRELLGASRLAPVDAERQTHRGSDADGRSTSDDHGLYGLGDLPGCLAVDVDLLGRQLALVDHHDRPVVPFDSWKHVA